MTIHSVAAEHGGLINKKESSWVKLKALTSGGLIMPSPSATHDTC